MGTADRGAAFARPSMSTVVLQDTKVLLSSWEVAAFVTEGGQESEDLRRAVVARALLGVAMDQRKRSGEETALASALVLAQQRSFLFSGPSGTGQAREEYRSGRESWDQHEAACFLASKKRKNSSP